MAKALSFLLLVILFPLKSPLNIGKQMQQLCNCNITPEQEAFLFPLDAVGDSVVLCKHGMVEFISKNKSEKITWLQQLQKAHMGGYGFRIIICKNKQEIKPKYGQYSVSYKNKSFIIHSQMAFDMYDDAKKIWRTGMIRDAYAQTVYAVAGNIKTGDNKIEVEPFKYSARALEMVDSTFKATVKMHSKNNSRLIIRLMGAALSGDQTSKERLYNFSKYLPVDNNDRDFYDDKVAIVRGYEKVKH